MNNTDLINIKSNESEINYLKRLEVPDTSSLITGWVRDAETWVYSGPNTITVPGDVTAKYPKGTKVKFLNPTLKQGYILGSNYSSPNTTLTFTGGSDYTLANSAITGNYYSYMETPQGFPCWFNYTPIWTAYTTNPVLGNGTLTGRFTINGRLCFVVFLLLMGSTTTYGSGTFQISLPVVALGGFDYTGSAKANNPGVANYTFVTRQIGTNMDFPCDVTGYYVNATTPFTWSAGDSLTGAISYLI